MAITSLAPPLQVPSHCTIASESSQWSSLARLVAQIFAAKKWSEWLKKGEWPWRKSSKSKDHNGLVWKTQEGHELWLLISAQNCTNYVDSTHFIFFTFFKKQTRLSQQAQARIRRANEKLTIAVAFLLENSVQFEIATLNHCNNATVSFIIPFAIWSWVARYRYWHGFIWWYCICSLKTRVAILHQLKLLQGLGNLLRAQIVYEHCSSHYHDTCAVGCSSTSFFVSCSLYGIPPPSIFDMWNGWEQHSTCTW